MPASEAVSLKPSFIEYIHDVLVSTFLPFDEKIPPGQYRDHGLIESAAARPFSTAFGVERWPSLAEKAAALFHSLACNHCFLNGNKRTAVIALDLFLGANQHLLTMSPDDVYQLAKKTATANQEGRNLDVVMAELTSQITDAAIPLSILENGSIRNQIGDEAYEKIRLHIDRLVNHLHAVVNSTNSFRLPMTYREETEKTCTYSPELRNHSSLTEHSATRCGKQATFRLGNPNNKSELYLCDEHAELMRNSGPWGPGSVVPLR